MDQGCVYLYSNKNFRGNIALMQFEVADVVDPATHMLEFKVLSVKQDGSVDESEYAMYSHTMKDKYFISKIQLTKMHLEDLPAWAQESFESFMKNKEVSKTLKKIILENQ